MQPDEIHALLIQEPFTPFLIHTDDGRAFEVSHPDLVLLSRHTAFVGFPEDCLGGPHPYVLRHETIALRHVVSLEALEAKAPDAGNGR